VSTKSLALRTAVGAAGFATSTSIWNVPMALDGALRDPSHRPRRARCDGSSLVIPPWREWSFDPGMYRVEYAL
jgi:hypothetical protein